MNYLILGFIQGVTEFFPISSSGHLLIGRILLGIEDNSLLLDVILHLGTLFSILMSLIRILLSSTSSFFATAFGFISNTLKRR